MVTIRRRVRVTGIVQGVFYRDSCRREANRLSVAGLVTNRDDGSVEAVFEGPRYAVEALITWCGRGPVSAKVDHVEVTEESPAGDVGFRIV